MLDESAGGSYKGTSPSVSDHGSNEGGEEQQLRRAVSASHFDSRNLFSIYHVRIMKTGQFSEGNALLEPETRR